MQLVNTTAFHWTMDAAGDWLCIQTDKARQVLDTLKEGKAYDVEIKEHREKRSLDANAYFWVLVDRLAEKIRIPKTDIYRRYIREIQPWKSCGTGGNTMGLAGRRIPWQAGSPAAPT